MTSGVTDRERQRQPCAVATGDPPIDPAVGSAAVQSAAVIGGVSPGSPQAIAQRFFRSLSTGEGLRPRHSWMSCAMAVAQTACVSGGACVWCLCITHSRACCTDGDAFENKRQIDRDGDGEGAHERALGAAPAWEVWPVANRHLCTFDTISCVSRTDMGCWGQDVSPLRVALANCRQPVPRNGAWDPWTTIRERRHQRPRLSIPTCSLLPAPTCMPSHGCSLIQTNSKPWTHRLQPRSESENPSTESCPAPHQTTHPETLARSHHITP